MGVPRGASQVERIGRLAAIAAAGAVVACATKEPAPAPENPLPTAAQPAAAQPHPQPTPPPDSQTDDSAKAGAGRDRNPTKIDRVTLADGLVIEDQVIGDGPLCASPSQIITVHYRGTLASGVEFDSSYQRGEPSTFELDRLIPGWREGVPGMRVGGRRRLTIPPDLAYGDAQRPGIPPGSTLVYEIELLAVK